MFAFFIYFFLGTGNANKSMNFSGKHCAFMFKLLLPISVHARLQVRQNAFSSRFLWNFVVSSCFFLVFQELDIHSGGLQPSITKYDLPCLHRQAATATQPSTPSHIEWKLLGWSNNFSWHPPVKWFLVGPGWVQPTNSSFINFTSANSGNNLSSSHLWISLHWNVFLKSIETSVDTW